MSTRPATVPANASEIPPAWRYPSGTLDPQQTAVADFQLTIAKINNREALNYFNYERDWQTNDAIYTYLGIQGPPKRPAPTPLVANVVWASQAGDVHPVQEPGDSAWIWES